MSKTMMKKTSAYKSESPQEQSSLDALLFQNDADNTDNGNDEVKAVPVAYKVPTKSQPNNFQHSL